MATPHIEAELRQIAPSILLPGDPLRAKYIADNYLTNVSQFNSVRNMFGYTGEYNGKRLSVMGTGMGMPSIGIYATELIKFYDVKTLIRVGSAGSIQPNVNVKDIIIGQSASTNSNFSTQYGLRGVLAGTSNYELLSKAAEQAKLKNLKYHVGNIMSSDTFYDFETDNWTKWAALGILGLEMEAYALYTIAAQHQVAALAICTISDSLVTHEVMSSEDRQKTLNEMIEIALEIA